MDALIRDGVSGLIICGTVGENCSLTTAEKGTALMETAKATAAGRVRDLRHRGIHHRLRRRNREGSRPRRVDGIMVMPALVYSSKPHETAAHFRGVAKATDLPSWF